MQKILIISTGGTFNKIYDPIAGDLVVEESSKAVKEIASKWLSRFELISSIGKDSLAMTNQDRLELLSIVTQSDHEKIIIIHGTDTMHVTGRIPCRCGDREKDHSYRSNGTLLHRPG